MEKLPFNALVIPFLILLVFFLLTQNLRKEKAPKEKPGLRPRNLSAGASLIIVYDNNEYNKSFKPDWGFSCLIKIGKDFILFDTGADWNILKENLEKTNLDINQIKYVFISHIHGDHTGGLWGFLKVNSNVTVYIPKSFPSDFKKRIELSGAGYFEISSFEEILPGMYSTGELGTWIKEQSLVLDTSKGLVIITGCAHPGVVNIVRNVKQNLNKSIYLVIGGFHLIGKSESEIRSIARDLKELGVRKVAPCHCSGALAREIFYEEFGDDYLEVGVGSIIQI